MALTQVDQGLLSSTAQYTGFKNRIINGAMMIDQRNAGASLTVSSNTLKYCVDRFGFQPVSASMSVQRTGSSGGPYSLQITGNTGSTGFNVIQKIESYNIADLAGQTVTLSFTISSAVLTSANAYYQTPTAQDNFGSLNTLTSIGAFSISSTPTQKSLTFTLPASAVNGLLLFVINGGALTSGTVTITGVQLEKGSTATSFDYRPYGIEDILCKRYFEELLCTDLASLGTGFQSATTSGRFAVRFTTAKRVAPTVTFTAASGFWVSRESNASSPTSIAASSTSVYGAYVTCAGLTAAGTSGMGIMLGADAGSSASIYADSEL